MDMLKYKWETILLGLKVALFSTRGICLFPVRCFSLPIYSICFFLVKDNWDGAVCRGVYLFLYCAWVLEKVSFLWKDKTMNSLFSSELIRIFLLSLL